MMVTLYGIPNCDTVKRARSWLAEQGLGARFVDVKRQGVPADALQRWLQAVGSDRLVNRQGTTWRKLDGADQAMAGTDAGVRALLSAQPSLIKRPVVEWPDGRITVGFDVQQWQAYRGNTPG